jgi:hypothetical protein
MSIKDEIRELCITHDKQMAEHDEWMAQREGAGSSAIRESEPVLNLIFKTNENGPAPSPAADSEPSDSDAPFSAAEMEHVLVEIIVHERRLARAERAEEMRPLERELAKLRGELHVAFGKSADVIDLPDWRRRDAA